MFKVIKRDGEIADFDLKKISSAIKKAFEATDTNYNTDMIELLSLRVTSDFQKQIKKDTIDVEAIQDSVEHVLVQTGYAAVSYTHLDMPRHRNADRLHRQGSLPASDAECC